MAPANPVIVALDVDSPAKALALAERLRGAVGAVKVGSQLFTAAGPDIVRRLTEAGHRVFLDLKYHDIPNTVASAAAEAAKLGAWIIDVHASGGIAMMKAAREAAHASAAKAGVPPPLIIAITVLTSFDQDTLGSIRGSALRHRTGRRAGVAGPGSGRRWRGRVTPGSGPAPRGTGRPLRADHAGHPSRRSAGRGPQAEG